MATVINFAAYRATAQAVQRIPRADMEAEMEDECGLKEIARRLDAQLARLTSLRQAWCEPTRTTAREASMPEPYRRPIEPGPLSLDARYAMRGAWNDRYNAMREAALRWQIITGDLDARSTPKPGWRVEGARAAYETYAAAACLLLRTPAVSREHLAWKRRNGTKDLLPAEEIAAIIAADAAWLEARNGRMRRRQKA